MANNQLLASDSFASGSLAAGWAAAFGYSECQVVGSNPYYTEPNVNGTQAGQIWTGLTWSNDQASEVTAHTLTKEANTYLRLQVRWQSGATSGYQADIVNGTVLLYRFDAGTPTQLGSTVSGLTFTTGDVWVLQAAGACLSVYQNNQRIIWWDDATYTSGSVGYAQQSGTIAHNQIASWRGYNAIQQDGIWQKQGIVLPALAADLPVGIWSPTILYEGGSQLGLGTGNVYKTWFTSTVSTGGTCYAESLDGISWTRKSGFVISGYGSCHLIKVGTTYYAYVQPLGGLGGSDFALFTSTDGVSFGSAVSTTVLAKGGVGQWDNGNFWDFTPIAVISGTWYALYTGGPSLLAAPGPQIGLAMSSDAQNGAGNAGIVWTKFASNPVLPGVWITSAFANVGGTYYFWLGACQPGQGGAIGYWDPNEIVRYSTTDFINWSGPVHSLHHSQMFESLNATPGQVFAGCILDIGGKAYLYSTPAPADTTDPKVYQIELAIANAPISSIVQANEDGVVQVATDSFTGGDGSLGANWATPTGGTALQIASHLVEPSATGSNCQAVWKGAGSFNNNQYSEVTIATLGSGDYVSPLVRAATNALTWYEIALNGPTGSPSNNGVYILRVVAGSAVQIGPSVQATTQIGDVWRLSVVTGSDGFPVLSLFQNDFLILQVQDTSSSAIASGMPGVLLYAPSTVSGAQISSWAGGNANSMPFATVSGALGAGGAGATVSYTGAGTGSTTADGSGNYSLIGLLNGSYTITPSKTGYTFSPTSANETVSGADITGVDFGATQTPLATPTFSPVAGSYGPTQSVSFTSTNATGFFYTTDGTTTPTHTGATPGTNTTYVAAGTPVSVAVTETLKVLAYDSTGTYADSSVATAAYTINGACGTPTFSPVAGTYTSAQTVTISSTTPSASIYWNTTGSPTSSDTLYTGPITVSASETVYAIAEKTNFSNSVVGSATYIINSTPSVYSVPDCRVAPFGPNTGVTVQGTIQYTGQTSSNPNIPSVDSRTHVPVDSRAANAGTTPQNSRTPGTYGPGE